MGAFTLLPQYQGRMGVHDAALIAHGAGARALDLIDRLATHLRREQSGRHHAHPCDLDTGAIT